jgi:tRNA A-37 threonylcarbamoyl transferase component Bud32
MQAEILERVEARAKQRRLDKECGKSYIPDKAKCSKPTQARAGKETLSQQLQGARSSAQELRATLQKTIARQSKSEVAANGSKAQPSSKQKPLPSKALIGFMGTLGIGAAAYLAIKAKYRAGFEQSAKEAVAIAQNIQPGTVKAKQHTIVFGVGGMAYGEANDPTRTGDRIVTAFKMAFSDAKGKDLKMVPIDNNDTNVAAGAKPSGAIDVAKIHWGNITNGKNKTSVNLAAQVIAYGDKYPDRQLMMMGHSYGGMVIHEAQEIIRRARPDYEKRLKSLAFGTQHYGLTESFGESHTVGSPADPFTAKMPTQNLKSFAKVKGHTQGEYFRDPEVQDFVKSVIYGAKQDSLGELSPIQKRIEFRLKRRLDKKCGESGIPEKAKCSKKVSLTAKEDPKKSGLAKTLATYGAAYSALVYGSLLALSAAEMLGGTSLEKRAPDFVADQRFDPSKIGTAKLPKIGEGLFGEAYLDKDAGVIYKKSRSTAEVVEKAKQNKEPIPLDPIAAWLVGNIPVQQTKANEAAAQYVAGQLGVGPKLLGKKGNVMAMEYLDGYKPGIKASYEVEDDFRRKSAEAIAALHVAGISHNDLHANNVMFKEVNGKVADVKIIDYGLARFNDYYGVANEAFNSVSHNTEQDFQELKGFKKALFKDLASAKSDKEKQKAIAAFYIKTGVMKSQKQDSLRTLSPKARLRQRHRSGQAFRIRLDAPNNCERGERCGDTCIDPNEECNIKNVSPELAAAIDDLSDAVLGAIPGYGQIVAAKKLVVTGNAALKVLKNPKTPLSKKVIMSAVILAGIGYLGYQKYRDYRRNAVGESASIAKVTAKGMATRTTQKDQITFTLDGTGKGDKQTLKTAMGKSGAFDTHEIIDFSESLDDPMALPDDMSDREKKIAREAEAAKNYFGSLTSGRSNHAVDLAAQILAYQEKYPQKRINVIAHGSGAQIAVEAAEIAKKARPGEIAQKLKVVNLQAPDYGIYDSVPGTTTVASDRHPATLLPMKNKTTFGVDDPGDGTGFFKNRRSLNYIKGYLQGGATDVRAYTPQGASRSAPATQRTTPANVPRSTFVASPGQGTLPLRTSSQGWNPFIKQEYETKKSNYESNVRSAESVVRSVEGQVNRLYREMEAASSDRLQELEAQAVNLVRTLNTKKSELVAHRAKLESHLNGAPKTDSVSTKVAIAALTDAALGAGVTPFNRRSKGSAVRGGR